MREDSVDVEDLRESVAANRSQHDLGLEQVGQIGRDEDEVGDVAIVVQPVAVVVGELNDERGRDRVLRRRPVDGSRRGGPVALDDRRERAGSRRDAAAARAVADVVALVELGDDQVRVRHREDPVAEEAHGAGDVDDGARRLSGRERALERPAERGVDARVEQAVAVAIREDHQDEGRSRQGPTVRHRHLDPARDLERLRVGLGDRGRDPIDGQVRGVRDRVGVAAGVVRRIEIRAVRAVVADRAVGVELSDAALEVGGNADGDRPLERGARDEREGRPGDDARGVTAALARRVELDRRRQVEGEEGAGRALGAAVRDDGAVDERIPRARFVTAVGEDEREIGRGFEHVEIGGGVVRWIGIRAADAIVSDRSGEPDGFDPRRKGRVEEHPKAAAGGGRLDQLEEWPGQGRSGGDSAVGGRDQRDAGRQLDFQGDSGRGAGAVVTDRDDEVEDRARGDGRLFVAQPDP